jgi:hypothetical protein
LKPVDDFVGEPGPTESLVTGDLPFLDLHAGQQPAVQRAERHDGQPELLTGWGELVFGGNEAGWSSSQTLGLLAVAAGRVRAGSGRDTGGPAHSGSLAGSAIVSSSSTDQNRLM